MIRRIWRLTSRTLLVLLAALLLFGVALLISGWRSFGASPTGTRQAQIEALPQWTGDRLENARKGYLNLGSALNRTFFGPEIPGQNPVEPVPTAQVSKGALATPPANGLRVTWFGHSSSLVELDGKRVLFDPFWGERASPIGWLGPKRWFAPLIPLTDLPAIDAVVISHDHYDHLDRPTIEALAKIGTKANTRFIVPLGIGAHLNYWGIPDSRITELQWWQAAKLDDVTITATPARHSTGRLSASSNKVLWAGYAITGPKHRLYYSGDTGFIPEFAEIGQRLGPFDLTLIETGQYDPAWPDNHLGPEQAVEVHQLVRGKTMIPVHWALISLAPHGWTEPVERTIAAAKCANIGLAVPRPGEVYEPGPQEGADPTNAVQGVPPVPAVQPITAASITTWWPSLPWKSVSEKPVWSTENGDPAQRFVGSGCVE